MASKILRPLLEKIALEYVTTERWHQEHIQEAIRAVDAAKKVVAAKQADLDAANDALDKAWRTLESTVEQFAPKRVTQ
jgi:carbamoylphosphate synthase large subunit